MKAFRTLVTPAKPAFTISHHDKLVSIGSCFSENIGKKFAELKFAININPFGQQYNPYSVATAINKLLNPVPYTKDDLVYHDELYHSYDHHGSFSRSTAKETLDVINSNLLAASEDLKKATILFLTFGTSHVFNLKAQGKIVSNCHKLSLNIFDRRLLSPQEITEVLSQSFQQLKKVNSNIKIVLTVSPVRYFAFGHYENSVSKAHLFTAIYELQKQHPEFYYFPAYELVMDDLRDYRFFSEDMLHPNYQASEYVWESLSNTMVDKKSLEVIKEIEEILLAAKHKPRNPQSEAHKKFVLKNLNKIENLKQLYKLDFKREEDLLNAYL
ncbi:MAG: hypothetical protein JWO06_407 [Bacteroidota bacterium]|nr:hypothetical protein [Bacteroidota bacterium]